MRSNLLNGALTMLWLSLACFAHPMHSRDQSSQPAECQQSTADGPFFIDSQCVDPIYNSPVTDSEQDYRSEAGFDIHEVQGHFENTRINFTIYLPSSENFQNRFFQNIYPLNIIIIEPQELVLFGADSGGYIVRVAGTIGYRHEAAAAKYARQVAAKFYSVSPESINGYVFGGSGGSYQTLGLLENTKDVWQGAVPFIQAIPTNQPLSGTSSSFSLLVLSDKRQDIIDALQPGGSGDPHATLSPMQSAVFDEISYLGFPSRGYEALNYTFASGGLPGAARAVRAFDPTYASDFWSLDGYLGTEKSDLGDFFRSLRYSGEFTDLVQNRNGSELVSIEVSDIGMNATLPVSTFTLVYANGSILSPLEGSVNDTTSQFTVTGPFNLSIPDDARLRYDNDWFLAIHAYHRYQVPRRVGFYPWYQFKNPQTETGTPIYPQRSIEAGPRNLRAPGGNATQTGKILFKAIMVQNLLDVNAQPWNADWYRGQIIRALGSDQEMFRLYYNDNADHNGPSPNNNFAPYIISYNTILYQALRDLANWVEKGVEPPRNTQYTVDPSQIHVPYEAKDRGGIQPVVHLCAGDDQRRVDVAAGDQVTFRAVADVPTTEGCIVKISWDYLGNGDWQDVGVDKAEESKEIFGNYTYTDPGTYFPAIRVGSSRDCKLDELIVIPYNLDRVRVVVQ